MVPVSAAQRNRGVRGDESALHPSGARAINGRTDSGSPRPSAERFSVRGLAGGRGRFQLQRGRRDSLDPHRHGDVETQPWKKAFAGAVVGSRAIVRCPTTGAERTGSMSNAKLEQNCQQILLEMDQYLDNSLAADERGKVLAHLNECSACSQELEARKNLRSRLRSSVKSIQTPPFLESRIRANLRE